MGDEMCHPMGEGVGLARPAPAMISSGEAMVARPSTMPCSTACRWWGLRVSSEDAVLFKAESFQQ